ncbi:NAD(P)-dependent oxidoreductase [Streptomyces sp. NPDC058240]|uniref:NAD(P)-dependent oxidoreductase n=1 Tax=Streptomyces sp. NPDC058240 TaxID=3346396 RepID=UPI0036E5684B
MSRVIIFGAGGRAGAAAVGEALRRGHRVTAVVRVPAKYRKLEAPGVGLVAGDVTDAEAVAALAAGHDAAIAAVHDAGAVPDAFFTAAARALTNGLTRAGVRRLVHVGLSATMETADGTPLMDTPGFPEEFRPFSHSHAAGTAVLRTAAGALDWLVVSPAGDFDHDGARSGRYTTAAVDPAARISYGDFAVALLDEADAPRHHRTHIGIVEI